MNFPEDLVRSPWPMAACPTPPDPGQTKQISYYNVEARLCTCCTDPPVRYYVHSIGGALLSMALTWRRLCHAMNWYPMDGLEPGERIPREAPKAPNKPKPRTVTIDRGQPEPLPLFAYEDS